MKRIRLGLLILLLAALACNLPSPQAATPELIVIYITQAPVVGLETSVPNAPASTATLPPVTHILYPADITLGGATFYDVDSRSTAPDHRAPYGDSYKLNRFERPFTANAMDYLPDTDILYFRLTSDQNWVYVAIEMGGLNALTNSLNANYGVELDLDRDGHGDFLIRATPPYTPSWSTDGVTVFTDTNNDTGGLSPERSDAVFTGNGYDQTIFSSGQGADPDLAWVRIDPRSSTTIHFAFKKTLTGSAFMWGAWADVGLNDPTRFNYNDYFTEEQAGSPEKSETQYYPIKAIHSLDNTCREAVGFNPTGYEPLLCPREEPTPQPRNTHIVPTVCQPPPYCVPPHYIWHQDTCWCEAIPW